MLREKFNTLLALVVKNRLTFAYGAAAIAVLNILVIWHIMAENTVYYWDLAGYWTYAIGLSNTLDSSVKAGVDLIIASFATDYNFLPITPIAVLMWMFGNDRIVYVLAILNLYAVPFSIIAAYLFNKHIVSFEKPYFVPVLMAVMLCMPPLLVPIFGNMPDVVGLLMIACILLAFSKSDILGGFTTKSFLLGVLIALLVVLRRWYLFWVVGAGVGLAVAILYLVWIRHRRQTNLESIKFLKWPLVNVAVMAVTAISVIAVLFPFIFDSFRMNYGDVYSAYRSGESVTHSVDVVQYFGGIALLLSCAGYASILTMRKKNQHKCAAVLFFVVSAIVIFIMFSKTQDFGAHHYYLLLPSIVFGLFGFAYWLMGIFSRKLVGLMLLAIWCGSITLYSFVLPSVSSTSSSSLLKILFGERKPPIINTDLEVTKEIARYLEGRPGLKYVVASSIRLNDDVLRKVNIPAGYTHGIIETAHIDKRDGFANSFFAADYVVVPNRPQIHTANGQGQLVVTELASSILAGEASNLTKVKTFTMKPDLQVYVYKKTGAYQQSFIDNLQATLSARYPGDSRFVEIGEGAEDVEIPMMKEKE